MKKILITIFALVAVTSCSTFNAYHDPYGSIDTSKLVNEKIKPVVVRPEPVKVTVTKIDDKDKNKNKEEVKDTTKVIAVEKSVTEEVKPVEKVNEELNKPITIPIKLPTKVIPGEPINVPKKTEELKMPTLVENTKPVEEIQKPVETQPEEVDKDLLNVTLSDDAIKVIGLLKSEYKLVESEDQMKALTIKAVQSIRKANNSDKLDGETINGKFILRRAFAAIKETKTRSYTLIVSRILTNLGVER